MRFKDFTHFKTRHPDLAELLETGGHDFLEEMHERASTGKDMTTKMLNALKKWSTKDEKRKLAIALLPAVGRVVREVTVLVDKVYTDPTKAVLMFEFAHPDGWRGRLKNVSQKAVKIYAETEGWDLKNTSKTVSGGSAFYIIIEHARVIWSKPAAVFAVLGARRGRTGGPPVLRIPEASALAEETEDVDPSTPISEAMAKGLSSAMGTFAEALKAAVDANPFSHDWQFDAVRDQRVCACCGEVVNSWLAAGDKRAAIEAFGGDCPGRTRSIEPVPTSSNPEGERAGLLPDFGDWRSKLGDF